MRLLQSKTFATVAKPTQVVVRQEADVLGLGAIRGR
jgi:hypothetical protein